MALSQVASGSQAATIGTAYDNQQTSAGTYIFQVDATNMANGDQLEITVKKKVRTGDSEIVLFTRTYANIQAEPLIETIPLLSLFSITMTFKQTVGTGRTFIWSVLSL
jgi:hypothetical protein